MSADDAAGWQAVHDPREMQAYSEDGLRVRAEA